MPKRPRAHEVEDLARRQFEAWLPDGWVARPLIHDYGIDYEVEIFEGGRATGANFWVQIKGSDALEEPLARIALSTMNYWRARDGLVLLVVWDVRERKGWYRWSHHIDTSTLTPEQRTMQVRVPRENVLKEGAVAAVQAEVLARRAWKHSGLLTPIAVRCIGQGSVGGISAGAVVSATRRALAGFPDAIHVGTNSAPVSITLRIGRDLILAEVSGGASVSFSFPTPLRGRDDYEATVALAWTGVLAVGLELFRMNVGNHAGDLVAAAWRQTPVSTQGPIPQILGALVASSRIDEAFEYIRAAGATYHGEGLEAVLGMMAMDVMPAHRGAEAAERLGRWGQQMADLGDRGGAARQFYNAGNRVRKTAPELSLQLLESAAAMDPSYKGRPYWWRDCAAAHYFAGNYQLAAEEYARAKELGATDVEALEADCLIMAGQYQRGAETLLAGADRDGVGGAEWRIKSRCLRALIDALGIDQQVRDRPGALAALGSELPSLEECLDALRHDMLFPPAIYGLAVYQDPHGEPDYALVAGAAAFSLGDPFAWLLALDAVPLTERALHEDVLLVVRRVAAPAIEDWLLEDGREPEALAMRALLDELPADPVAPIIARVTEAGSTAYVEVHDDDVDGLGG